MNICVVFEFGNTSNFEQTCFEVESREHFSMLLSSSFSSSNRSGAAWSPGVLHAASPRDSRALASLSGFCFLLLLPHSINPFNPFVSYTLLFPTKVLPNHMLKPAQFIFCTAFLFPTLLEGKKLGLDNSEKKARRGPHHGFAIE